MAATKYIMFDVNGDWCAQYPNLEALKRDLDDMGFDDGQVVMIATVTKVEPFRVESRRVVNLTKA